MVTFFAYFSFKSWWEVRPLSVSGSSPGHRKHQRQSCHGRSASRSLELSNNLNSFGEAFDIGRVTAAFHSGVPGPAWPDESSHSPWNDAKGRHLTNQTRNKRPTTNQSFSSSFIPCSTPASRLQALPCSSGTHSQPMQL